MKKALVIFVLFATLVSLLAVNVSAVESSELSDEAPSVDTLPEVSAVNSTETDGAVNINFSTQNVSTALKHLVIGMVGVIIVLALIALVVFILNNVTKS